MSPPEAVSAAWWPRFRVVLLTAFFVIVGVLLIVSAREIEWQNVGEALRGYGAATLLGAAALAAIGHLVYTSYDVLGRFYTGHSLPVPRVMTIAFVSYAFNLNLGPLVGAAGFRFRLYSRYGLDNAVIGRVLGFSVLTNWLGYFVVAGVVFASGSVAVPPSWVIGSTALQITGAAMLLLVAGFLLLCGRAERRSFHVRSVEIELPPLRIAMLQPVVSAASWLVIGVVIWVLLGQAIPFATVLGVTMLAAVAALLTHIPAGIGVLELVFVLMLEHEIQRSDILASLLAYRAVYYLAPLLVAGGVYLALEARSDAAG